MLFQHFTSKNTKVTEHGRVCERERRTNRGHEHRGRVKRRRAVAAPVPHVLPIEFCTGQGAGEREAYTSQASRGKVYSTIHCFLLAKLKVLF